MAAKTEKVRTLKLEELKSHLIQNGPNSKHHEHCLAELRRRAADAHQTRDGHKYVADAAHLLAEYEAQHDKKEKVDVKVKPSW